MKSLSRFGKYLKVITSRKSKSEEKIFNYTFKNCNIVIDDVIIRIKLNNAK